MVTVEEIKRAAKYLGKKIEENEYHIGFEYSNYCYYWWFKCKDGDAIFLHIYSQNTGKKTKSFKRSFSAEQKIKKFGGS